MRADSLLYPHKRSFVRPHIQMNMAEQTTLNLVYKLCKALEAEEVAYCHWKSNVALDRSASGDNDLDLLVSRGYVQRFTEILYRLGFKEVLCPSEKNLPGVLNYYGYDKEADRLVHVHAHYQLILGHDMTKNYRLPIERPFLESSFQDNLFRIPTPEFEFIVFVIRMMLKHSTWDVILVRQGTLPKPARRELKYLESRIDETQVYPLLRQYLPSINPRLFDDCVRSLRPDCPIWTRIKAGRQLQQALQPNARRAQVPETCLKLWRRVLRAVWWRVFGHSARKRLAVGGAMIALVGGDGAGKSTAVDELYSWLSKEFDTIKVHFGKPSWSWTSFAVKGTLKVSGSLGIFLKGKSSVRPRTDTDLLVSAGYSQWLWNICTARDRYRTYVKARRYASNGGLVICDRYPLPQVRLMDGSHSDQMIDMGQANRLIEFLAQAEKKYYQKILPPDLLIVLRVDPEIAVQRKMTEDAALVRARCQEMWEWGCQQPIAHVLDACRSQPEVLSDLKFLIWSEL
jgi:thymidylate kinase